MKIKFFCPMWGMEAMTYAEAAKKVKAAGYDGMEINVWDGKYEEVIKAMKDNGLELILMSIVGGSSFEEYKKNHSERLEKAASYHPIKINSHTGRDFYSFAQNGELVKIADEIQRKSGVTILHETHRSRFTYSLPAIQDYLSTFPNLRLVGDYSHWVNVSESLLADQPENLERVILRTDHIHSRIGHSEGPQVNDPRAPEWKNEVNAHLAWWDKIVANHKKIGSETLTITTEFGPANYMPTVPYTQQPIASQWDINVYMKDLLQKRYS